MTNKFKVMLLSCVTILLCVATISVGTFALWSQQVKIQTHLSAGTLNVQLFRTNLERKVSGQVSTNPNSIDFTGTNHANANIFDIEQGDNIYPGDYFEATMKLVNNGSVDVKYTVKIVVYAADNTSSKDNALAEQLTVTVDGASLVGDTTAEKLLSAGTDSVFVIRVNFDDLGLNTAQGGLANLDITVTATQNT